MPNQPLAQIQIDEQTLISRSANLLAARVRDETLIMNLVNERYYGIDDIGTAIWQHLEEPRTFGTLIDSLAAEYDADRDTIVADVRQLLTIMREHEVVRLG